MEGIKRYDNYPVQTVLISNLVSVGIYGFGLYIIQKTGWVFAMAYLLYIFIFEYRLLKQHCTKCYYWGRTCGFGRSRLSTLLFKKGDVSKFCLKEMTWKDMIPDLLISLVPVFTGIVLLILSFDMMILAALLILILLTTMGNAYVRGTLACKFCKQKELGCPADMLFSKQKHLS